METCLYKGKQICAYDVTNLNYALNYELKKEWRIAGRSGELICQECGKEVQLRINDPRKRTPHFSHKVTDDKCIFVNNDQRESEEHKKGKMLLYHYFKDRYPETNPIINYRFPNRRKADLYIEFDNGDKLAIEYQRTELDILEWEERHEKYRRSNINILWLIGGKEENIVAKKKQVEVTFFQQIMINELDKVAIYLDVGKGKFIFVKNMRYLDPYVKNNDFEELYIKSYKIDDVLIHTNGKVECNFIDEYKKANDKFIKYYAKKCLDKENDRQRIKEEELRFREQLQEERYYEDKSYSRFKETKFQTEPKYYPKIIENKPEAKESEKVNRYFEGNIYYKSKLKKAIEGNENAIKETARHLMEWGSSDDPKIVTLICKFHYMKGNKKVKEVYEKIMAEAGLEGVSLQESNDKVKFECPFCKGKLNEKYGRYGPYVSCSNHPKCNFSFN